MAATLHKMIPKSEDDNNGVEKTDVALIAKERLSAKKKAIQVLQWIRRVIVLSFLLFLCGVVGLGYWLYQGRAVSFVSDYRPCETEVGDYVITGQREYRYKYTEILGHRFIDTQDISTVTTIEYPGKEMMVVGVDGDAWWSVKVGKGEFGKLTTKPAKQYTFVVDGRVNVVPSTVFCK